jgi:hypothetical protein
VTDTVVLDAMMEVLARNPLPSGERVNAPATPVLTVDDKHFYARREVEIENKRYASRVDLFHQDLTVVRQERARRGPCDACGGVVHAVQTTIQGAVRVDGRCLSCGWEVHRAGLLS